MRKRCAVAAGLPRALAVAQAHDGGAPTLGNSSMGVAGLGEPPGWSVRHEGGLQNDVAMMW
jgi:hypothetical protein